MATSVRAEAISASNLSAAIDKAVKIAADRHQVAVSDTNLIVNWQLVGRALRDAALAQQFATDVAKQVSLATGATLQPSTFQVGKHIWCGYIDKTKIPVAHPLG
jgi:TRAP-type mannitol/chloroaromatic compound transport system substrate-binding protein